MRPIASVPASLRPSLPGPHSPHHAGSRGLGRAIVRSVEGTHGPDLSGMQGELVGTVNFGFPFSFSF